MPAKKGMGQQQLSQEMGNLPKKIRPIARGSMQKYSHLYSKRTTPQKAQN